MHGRHRGAVERTLHGAQADDQRRVRRGANGRGNPNRQGARGEFVVGEEHQGGLDGVDERGRRTGGPGAGEAARESPGERGGIRRQRGRAGEDDAPGGGRRVVVGMEPAEDGGGDRETGDRPGRHGAQRRTDRLPVVRVGPGPRDRCGGQRAGEQQFGNILERVLGEERRERIPAQLDAVVAQLGDRRRDLHVDRRPRCLVVATSRRPDRVEFVDGEQRRPTVGGTDP